MGRTLSTEQFVLDSSVNAAIDASVASAVDGLATKTETLTNKTLASPNINSALLNNGYTEEVFRLTTSNISASNGSIQKTTLLNNTTFTATIGNGQSVLLMIDPGSFAVTWPNVVWASGTAPGLTAGKFNSIVLWTVDNVLYGSLFGIMG